MSKAHETWDRIQRAGFFRSLDLQMAGLAGRIAGRAGEPVWLAVALASRSVGRGHSCVDLADWAGRKWADVIQEERRTGSSTGEEPAPEVEDLGVLPAWEEWKARLTSKDSRLLVGGPADSTLLVLHGSRLYLRRYWEYERKVEARLQLLHQIPVGDSPEGPWVERYLAGAKPAQVEAARKALMRRLSLLSGGPGTGKTYVLARILALWVQGNWGRPLNIRIAAPTGKAAARVADSVREAKAQMRECGVEEAVLAAIPEEATTLHRLLGARQHSPYFKHDASNRLVADHVIVDECSMIDLPLMAKLVDALPDDCRLLLVGDRDQLASVEPGSVYGDLCRAAMDGGPLEGCLTQLTDSTRFPEDSAIGKVSQAIRRGDPDAWACLGSASDRCPSLRVMDSTVLDSSKGFRTLVERQFADYLAARDPGVALEASKRFRILCALRRGPFGMIRINRLVEEILAGAGLKPGARFYDHQLILVTANTPALGLFNGDVGVVLASGGEDGNAAGELFAWFAGENQVLRAVPVHLLPGHETAFAMTVHKSQGSEFPNVAMILPADGDSAVLTRELLYTGMTRVRLGRIPGDGCLMLWCTQASFTAAVQHKTERETGLFVS